MQVSRATADDGLDGGDLRLPVAPGHGRPQPTHPVIELHQRDAVVRVQPLHHHAGAALGLLQRLAAHRARLVNHQCQRLGLTRYGGGVGGPVGCLQAQQHVDRGVLAFRQAGAGRLQDDLGGEGRGGLGGCGVVHA